MAKVTTQSSLLFTLKVVLDGTEEDGVTPKRITYVAVESCLGCFQTLEQEKLQKVLTEQKVRHKFMPRTLEHDNFIAIEIKDMFTVIRHMEDAGWMIKDHVPFFVWKVVSESVQKPRLESHLVRDRVGPELWNILHPYQQVGVRFAAEKEHAYIADEMGTGKTLQSLVACKYFETDWPVLVVCPSSLRYTWRTEIMQWLGLAESDVFVVKAGKALFAPEPPPIKAEHQCSPDAWKIYGKKVKAHEKKLQAYRKGPAIHHKFLIISYSLLAKQTIEQWLCQKRYRVSVLDECHYIKSLSSKRSRAAIKVTKPSKVRLLLSGTPFNYPSEMFQQIKVMDPTIYPWFFNFGANGAEEPGKYFYGLRYCKPHRIQFRNRDQWVFKGYDNHEELNAVFNTFMIRRRKHEILTQLPPKNRICITLDPLTTKQEQEIAKLLKEEKKEKRMDPSEERKRAVTGGPVKVKGGPEKYMKSFRLANQYKIPHVIKFVKDHIIDDLMTECPTMKTLIFMHHNVMREALETCLNEKGMTFFVINGKTTPLKRDEYVQAFQNTDQYRVGLLSVTAAGVGLTLTAAQTVVFTEILFGPDQHLQAEDRAHRLGQQNDVNIFYLLEPKTTDDINFGMIRKKERESSTMLDGKANMLQTSRMTMPDAGERHLSRLLMPKKIKVSRVKSQKRRAQPSMEDFVTDNTGPRRITVKRRRREVTVMRLSEE